MTEAEKVAASLTKRESDTLLGCDPDHVVAPVADMLNLALLGLAEVRRDNTVFLTPLGLAVRAHILKGNPDNVR